MQRYTIVACHVLWRELCYYAALSRHCFQFRFLEQGLHNAPDVLRREVQAAVDAVDGAGCDAVLVGYGLCSNGLVGIEARDVPLVVMRGHDCITLLLGSKERYREYFDGHGGTYWYSPGWIQTNTQPSKERYEQALQEYVATYGEENARYLMETAHDWVNQYSNAAYVDLGFGESEAYKAYTKECADWLGWSCDLLEGDPRLIQDFLEGAWDTERFLVVEPGHRIVAPHDETIVAAEKIQKGSGHGNVGAE